MKNKKLEEQIKDGVIVPLLQSVISGILIGIATGMGITVGIALGFTGGLWNIPIKTTLLATFISMTLFWFSLIGKWSERLNSAFNVAKPEIRVPAAAYANETINVTVHDESKNSEYSGSFLKLSGGYDHLIDFARGITSGKSTATSSWVGPGMYKRNEYNRIRDELISRKCAAWKNPHEKRGGWELTKSGMAVMRHLATLGDSTPPLGPKITKSLGF